MRWSTDEAQLDQAVANVKVEAVVEDEGRRPDREVTPVDLAEDRLEAANGLVANTFAAVAVTDDDCVGEQAVAVGVVAMVMGVDERLHRWRRDAADGVE